MRVCSKPEDRDKRLAELKELLLARNYPETLIDRSIEKGEKIPRKIALLKVQKSLVKLALSLLFNMILD